MTLRKVYAEPDSAASAAKFAAGLQAEADALGAFIGLLQAEQDVLVTGDADSLAALAAEKTAQISLLTTLGEQRKRHFADQDLPETPDGMLNWLGRNHRNAGTVRKLWPELLARADAARQLNHTNGILIRGRLQQNQMKLDMLQTVAGSGGVYRPDGRLRPLFSARSFSRV